MYKRMAKFYV